MKLIHEVTIYENPDPLLVSRQACFAGIVCLPDGDLLAMFSMGQAFDSADRRMWVSKSSDGGQSWEAPHRMHDHVYAPLEQSESFKPLALADGTLLATGYVFVRPDALTPIVDPETFELLELKNMVARSLDNGASWEVPRHMDIGGAPLEMSGPCIQLASGRILGAAAPFHLGPGGHSGWIVYSDDGGASWGKLSEFFNSPGGQIAPWECRLCEMAPGQVAVLFWAYDAKNKRNLTNHIVFSRDGGETFGAAVDTKVHGQASNLMWLGGETILTIHAHRESPVGLWVREVDTTGARFRVVQEINLFENEAMGSQTEDIRAQFASLKFGQPSLLGLPDKRILGACWAVENCQYVIKGYLLEL
ncbi:MAG: exo-alpha-sialidase [Alphaproteobacteria bacterium]|nr:exo-alpha-sialidase [Alphaproteobacteria bacterium]